MTVRSERVGSTLLVTLDRPEAHNAMSRAMSDALTDAWYRLRDDPELRVAVLHGAGGRAFCAGADLKEIGAFYDSMSPAERLARSEREPGLGGLTRNLDPGKPIVAAIGGHCLGGGLELALACDLRVAAEHASFGLPEVRWGLIPAAGGTQRLPRAMPLGLALEMLLTGDPIDATRALAAGLVNAVVPAGDLLPTALELAERIARNAPIAVQAARAAALAGLHLPLDEALSLEQRLAEPARQSKDLQEGLLAFRERRPPAFTGR